MVTVTTPGAYAVLGKRALDVCLASVALVVLSPVLAAIWITVRLADGSPVIFRQQRIGRHGRPFTIYKFRSMPTHVSDVPKAHAHALPVTPIGWVLRRTYVDELPQLVNVLRGDMSLVGPRPVIPAQQNVTALRARSGALRVRPGLTGLAQIRAYTGMEDEERVLYDMMYVRNMSVLGDVGILVKTTAHVLRPPPVH